MSESTAAAKSMESKPQAQPQRESATFICSRDTLDGSYPSLILAINARRLGMDATVFYTFMGINVIRKGGAGKVKFVPNGTLGAIPGMSAFATWMMRKKIDAVGIPPLDEMIDMARAEGVRFVACKMTAEMMDLKPGDFIDGVVINNAEEYLKHARDCKINMFT